MKQDSPLVTVIIPTYNCSKYLPRAIDSVLNQTYQEVEIIIIDDGSVDNTNEIVKKYLSKYRNKIRYFYQENKGPGAARNRGISEATGEFIAFLDADDELLLDSLFVRINFLNKYIQVAMVFTDYYEREKETENEFSGFSSMLKKHNFIYSAEAMIESSVQEEVIFNSKFYDRYLSFRPRPIWANTVMVRNCVLQNKVLFRTDISVAEDRDFWLRITENNIIGFIDKPTAIYNRYTLNSLTKNIEKSCLDSIKQFLSIHNKRISRNLLKKKIGNEYFSLGYYYFSVYNFKNAIKYFLLSIRSNFFQNKAFIYLAISLLPLKVIKYFRGIKNIFTKR